MARRRKTWLIMTTWDIRVFEALDVSTAMVTKHPKSITEGSSDGTTQEGSSTDSHS